MAEYNATIEEQGNGFPDVGDYCEGEGQLWHVLEMASRIQTGDTNYVYARVESADYADCDESDVHTARVVTDTQGVI